MTICATCGDLNDFIGDRGITPLYPELLIAGPENLIAAGGAKLVPPLLKAAAPWFKAAPVAAKGIGATGKIGENALKALGGESQVYFRTGQGGRYVDQLVNGIANESKVGYTSLTSDIRLQISKDVELMNTGQINGSTWHFFQSPVTGMGGPSGPLSEFLEQSGIGVVRH